MRNDENQNENEEGKERKKERKTYITKLVLDYSTGLNFIHSCEDDVGHIGSRSGKEGHKDTESSHNWVLAILLDELAHTIGQTACRTDSKRISLENIAHWLVLATAIGVVTGSVIRLVNEVEEESGWNVSGWCGKHEVDDRNINRRDGRDTEKLRDDFVGDWMHGSVDELLRELNLLFRELGGSLEHLLSSTDFFITI